MNDVAITNSQHKTNFRLDIPDSGESLGFQLALQDVVIPSVEIEPTKVAINPMLMGDIAGSAMRFEPLNLRYLLDEDMTAYLELFKWMISIVDYRENKSTAQVEGSRPRTMQLHILDNSKKKIVATFVFKDAWPGTLGQLEFGYTDDGNPAIVGDIMFYYKSFDIVVNGVTITPSKLRISDMKSFTRK
ncbi:MAG: phage tail protein [Culicoidibacterales bacterium]